MDRQMIELTPQQMADHERGQRPLYAPLRTFPACAGNCGQGRKPCVTPQECMLPEEDAPGAGAGIFIWPAVMALCMFAVFLAVHLWRAA